MTVQNLRPQASFITKDGSAIRSIETRSLPTSLAATHRGFAFYVALPKAPFSIARMRPFQNQSLAEARVPAGGRTERHYHKVAEETLFSSSKAPAEIELDGERRLVGPGRCDPHPSGAWHTIMAKRPLRFLCCCAPPYAHEDTYFPNNAKATVSAESSKSAARIGGRAERGQGERIER
jgi:mannose-6-phosphate isomerase-like protein (cupin superfamily)